MINFQKILVLVAILATAALVSCDDSGNLEKEKEIRLLKQYLEANNITTEPQTSGLYFIPVSDGDGSQPQLSDWVIIRYTGRLVNDRIFDTTDESVARSNNIYYSSLMYGDKRMLLQNLGLLGMQEGLRMMREGGTAKLIIPSHLAHGSSGMGEVPGYSTLIYEVELVKVIKDPVAYEQQIIDEYIGLYADSTHLTVEKQESGLFYIELVEGEGEGITDDSERASVYYKGTHIDGRVFDSNFGGTLYIFNLGNSETIKGFEEGIRLMKLEGWSRLVIPSSLGYGVEGSGEKIPGYSPLVFDIRLVDIQ